MTDILHEELIALIFPISGSDHVVEDILRTGIGIKFFGIKFGLLILINILGDFVLSFVVDE